MVKEVASKTSDVAGDGTTTATVLAEAIYTHGLKAVTSGFNSMEIKRGIDKAVDGVVGSLEGQSKKVKDHSEVAQIGTISANGDNAIGELIAEAMDKVGKDGTITVEEAKSTETTLDVVEGMQFDRGYLSPYFVTDQESMEAVLEDCYLLIHEKKIDNLKDLLPLLEKASKAGKPLLIIAEESSHVSYLEGCTAPMRDENQLHAAVVELVALDNAEIKYSTVQNWYPGDEEGRGGIYNFVTKRGICKTNAKISWTQVETGSAITWKYPSVILKGDNSIGEFYSVALTNNMQQADTGSKMVHLGKNTRSTIVSKGISAGRGQNSYRGLVQVGKKATNARNFSQCDSLLIGDQCGAHTFPYIEAKNPSANIEHEATTSKIGEDQIFYCNQRGLETQDAVNMIVNGFCKEVFRELPMEFAMEAQKLLDVSLEGSVG